MDQEHTKRNEKQKKYRDLFDAVSDVRLLKLRQMFELILFRIHFTHFNIKK